MNVGSLFSGIGGFDLAAQWMGWETKWYSEIDPYACRVMQKHFPRAYNVGDITTWEPVADAAGEQYRIQPRNQPQTNAKIGKGGEADGRDSEPCQRNSDSVDLICGGFPCQPVSVAGKQLAQDDPRWLWPHFARVIRALRSRYVVIENVSGLLVRGGRDVLCDLAAIGLTAEWETISAAAVGAPHRRDRVWLVAYPASTDAWCGTRQPEGQEPTDGQPSQFLPNASDRSRTAEAGSHHGDVADAASTRCSQGGCETGRSLRHETRGPEPQRRDSGSGTEDVADAPGGSTRKPQAGYGREGVGRGSQEDVADAERIDTRRYSEWWPSGLGWWEWEPEEVIQHVGQGGGQENGVPIAQSQLGRVAHGVPARVDRLKCLGNSIVPQIAYWIFQQIEKVEV